MKKSQCFLFLAKTQVFVRFFGQKSILNLFSGSVGRFGVGGGAINESRITRGITGFRWKKSKFPNLPKIVKNWSWNSVGMFFTCF